MRWNDVSIPNLRRCSRWRVRMDTWFHPTAYMITLIKAALDDVGGNLTDQEGVPWASCQICKIVGCACAGNAGNFSPPQLVSDPDMHHGTCLTRVSWCMPGSLISGFLWSQWRGKRSRHSRRMRNQQFYVSGKRPIVSLWVNTHFVLNQCRMFYEYCLSHLTSANPFPLFCVKSFFI